MFNISRLLILLLGFFVSMAGTAKPLNYYLPSDISYNPAITTPSDYLGYDVGDWHVRHDQLVGYMKLLASQSPRMRLDVIGHTHEQRQLVQLVVSDVENMANIQALQTRHLASQYNADDGAPLVLNMGYSVHGNESSGSNASMLVAYYLAAGEGEQVKTLLRNSIILLDPSLNPDGLDRFASWVNLNKSKTVNRDPNNRELNQNWPSSRTNHYWFDLNRDWLLLTHPESKARIDRFHQWRPHVLTDFHEMGSHSTYFFQPGIPSRKNPMTSDENVKLTMALAEFHAEALDILGSLYFTEESYDDFYYGKGSTYPDINGSIGILFEQASSRGHAQETINGPLDFPFTIRNQVTTSLSTFAGAIANRQSLKAMQTDFYSTALDKANRLDDSGYLVGIKNDSYRLQAMVELLQRHKIKVEQLDESVNIEDVDYRAGEAIWVSLRQEQFRLIQSLFSTRTDFPDNTFYDVSSWTLPYAFDADFIALSERSKRKLKTSSWQPVSTELNEVQGAYAYAFDWRQYQAPALAYQLLAKGYRLRVANKGFTADTTTGKVDFRPGTILIPASIQQQGLPLIADLAALQENYGIAIESINSGLTSSGIDLGSRNMTPMVLPKVLVVGGEATSEYEVGEFWHYTDTRLHMPVTLVEDRNLLSVDLNQYTHVVMVNGRYNALADAWTEKLSQWVMQGGIVVAQKNGVKWLTQTGLLNAKILNNEEMDAAFSTAGLSYAEQDALTSKKRIAGAIYATEVDVSHPLAYGLTDNSLPTFKNSRMVMSSELPFVAVAKYQASPLLAGFTDSRNVELIANSIAVMAQSKGRGSVIAFADNMNFRGYFYGSSRLMANALFFGHLVDTPTN